MTTSVLIVDDDEAVRLVTVEMLRHMDCAVDSADSGASALAKLEEQDFDLVLLDVGMPVMSGTEVYAEIQKSYPRQRVVFMTGYSEQEILDETSQQTTQTSVLSKPFTLRELEATIRDFLRP